MRRRRFLRALCVTSASFASCIRPAYAQLPSGPSKKRRVVVLITLAAEDCEAARRLNRCRDGLKQAGWVEGDNLHLEIRWGASDPERSRHHAAQLAAEAPDAILATGSAALDRVRPAPYRSCSYTYPILLEISSSVSRSGIATWWSGRLIGGCTATGAALRLVMLLLWVVVAAGLVGLPVRELPHVGRLSQWARSRVRSTRHLPGRSR
jgi:hypothetical protein